MAARNGPIYVITTESIPKIPCDLFASSLEKIAFAAFYAHLVLEVEWNYTR